MPFGRSDAFRLQSVSWHVVVVVVIFTEHVRDWKPKIRRWWCDALSGTYMYNILKVPCMLRRGLFVVSFYFIYDSFYIPFSIWFFSSLPSHPYIWKFFSLHCLNRWETLQHLTIHHCQFTYFIPILNFQSCAEITSSPFRQNLFIAPDFLVTAHNTPLWCFIKYFKEISSGAEIEFTF